MTSIPKPGLPTSLRNSPIIRRSGSTNCCPGIGRPAKSKSKPPPNCASQGQSVMPVVLAECIQRKRQARRRNLPRANLSLAVLSRETRSSPLIKRQLTALRTRAPPWDDNGYASWAIERDEKTDKPFMVVNTQSRLGITRTPVADREKAARSAPICKPIRAAPRSTFCGQVTCRRAKPLSHTTTAASPFTSDDATNMPVRKGRYAGAPSGTGHVPLMARRDERAKPQCHCVPGALSTP
jgi:hypothetical protein